MSFQTPILTGGGASDQSIRQIVTDPRHRVGTRGQTPDGRVFYYARSSGAALDPGKLAMSQVTTANFININPSAAAAVRATQVAVTLGGSETVAKDAYEGGYLVVNDAAGEGHTYVIKGNTAVAAGTAITIDLADEIEVALTTSSEVCLMLNPWADVVIAAGGHVHKAAGVPQVEVPSGSSTSQYFWLQTWGMTAGWDDDVTAVGAALQSGTTAGQFEVGDGAAQLVGTQLVAGVATEYRPKFLTIAP